jgi:SAM-dependent methyltransferase
MGVTFSSILRLKGLGLLETANLRVLDIGCSNLYQATEEDIRKFVEEFAGESSVHTQALIKGLAEGSAYDPVHGGKNEAFVGEMLEIAGFPYDSIDIADGFKTTILDLNYQRAPQSFLNAFDLVINFGTTEHLLNQLNAFQFVHDCTKPGGHIVHSVPCVGYSNHGYLTFTPRCIFDLAGYNDYEIVDFAYDVAQFGSNLMQPVRDYSSYFPRLASCASLSDEAANVPDIGLFVVLKKKHDRPFLGALEITTSVGSIPCTVTDNYENRATGVDEDASADESVGTEQPSSRMDKFLAKIFGERR